MSQFGENPSLMNLPLRSAADTSTLFFRDFLAQVSVCLTPMANARQQRKIRRLPTN